MTHIGVVGMALADKGALGAVQVTPAARSFAAERPLPPWWTCTPSVNRVAASSVLALAVMLTVVTPSPIGTLFLALLPFIARETVTLSVDMVAMCPVVAI